MSHVWVWWIVGGVVAWILLAGLVAVVVGRGIRIADRRSPGSAPARELSTADVPFLAGLPASPAARMPQPKRRRLPLPPVAVALAAVGVLLEAVGFLLRLSGAHGQTARLLSMDAPLSVPRMYITALFATASIAALSAAGRIPGRRTWWSAVGAVGAGITFVKAGGDVHAAALRWLSRTVGPGMAFVISVLLAVAVVAMLWFLARAERRDRLRVLGSLALYAGAAVGLSAVSVTVTGLRAGATATFFEESGEALGAVFFLVAVLVGVAPRLVLPADWPLRRTADAHTLDVEPVGVRRTAHGR
jgi:hypothetical protein